MNEEEIRPNEIFNEYLRLCAKDSHKYFKNAKKNSINCPACEHKGDYSFTKNEFEYNLCKDILKNNQELIKDRFWKTFIKNSTEESRERMQSLISKEGLSSHMMIVCQK